MKYKILPLLLLLTMLSHQSFGWINSTLTVHLHTNGYKGNLYYRTGGPQFLTYHWFYVKNAKGDTLITLEGDANQVYDLFNGWDYFSFQKQGQTVKITIGAKSGTIRVNTPSDIDLTLKTTCIKIKSGGIAIPYVLSAYALIPGYPSTDGTKYRPIYHDTTVSVIKGMTYSIDNQSYIYLLKSLFNKPMPCNKGFVDYDPDPNPTTQAAAPFHQLHKREVHPIEQYQDNFTFTVNTHNKIEKITVGAAHSKRNILIFNTVKVHLDASCISNGNPIQINHNFNGLTDLPSDTTIRLIKGLVNYLRWHVGSVQHDLYYAQ